MPMLNSETRNRILSAYATLMIFASVFCLLWPFIRLIVESRGVNPLRVFAFWIASATSCFIVSQVILLLVELDRNLGKRTSSPDVLITSLFTKWNHLKNMMFSLCIDHAQLISSKSSTGIDPPVI